MVFNKGALINAGFLEATKHEQFDCVLSHDVDVFLEDDRNLVACYDDVIHLSPYLEKHRRRYV